MSNLRNKLKLMLLPRLSKLNLVADILGSEHFTIADVGSTGGLDLRWSSLEKMACIYAFDPDQRASVGSGQEVMFPFGLWSSEATLQLNLTRFPDASSVYLPNEKLLSDFLNASCHEIVGHQDIQVMTMEQALAEMAPPDFIKVDAEGADMAILQGANRFIHSNCVGVQAEVQFVERNISAPLFGEIDALLRSHGYTLLTLHREFWVRKNCGWGLDSQPQLIWADAIYLLSADQALVRMTHAGTYERKKLLAKLVLTATVYGAHDYALDVVQKFLAQGFVEKEVANVLSEFIIANIRSFWSVLTRRILVFLLASIILTGTLVFTSQREVAIRFFRLSLARLFHSLYLAFARTGENRAALNDGLF
jgi:FkbM family methyltransferase